MPISLGVVTTGRTVFASDLIAATRRLILGRSRQAANQLAGDITDTDLNIVFTHQLAGMAAGATLAVGLEEMLVWSVDANNNTVTVQRGVNGSVPANHLGGDLVAVDPRVSDFEIFVALNDDLADLSSPANGLFQIRTVDLTAVSGQRGYDFPFTDFISVADIRWQVPGTVTKEWRQVTDFTVEQQLPTVAFPSGTSLYFNSHELPTPGQTVTVRYRAQLGQLTSTADDAASVTGLAALDIPPLGAALRIMAGRPIPRADYLRQGDTRRADEVRVSEVVQAPAALRQERQARIAAEATRLNQQWPQVLRPRVML